MSGYPRNAIVHCTYSTSSHPNAIITTILVALTVRARAVANCHTAALAVLHDPRVSLNVFKSNSLLGIKDQ
jgi:hypothetical protein